MADTFKKLWQAFLGNGAPATLYTAPALTTVIVKQMKLVNVDASARTAKLWHDGTSDINTILPTITLEAGGFGEWDGAMELDAGDTISGQADAASKVVSVGYGLEMA